MQTVNMLQAKSSLSRLVKAIEQGEAREIVIARNGRPAARLVPIETALSENRIGVAKGLFVVPDSIDAHNNEVAQLFRGEMSLESATGYSCRSMGSPIALFLSQKARDLIASPKPSFGSARRVSGKLPLSMRWPPKRCLRTSKIRSTACLSLRHW